MAIYQLPDGKRYSVPDSIPREQAIAKLKEKFGGGQPQQAPQPKEGIGRTVLEQGLQGATFGLADEISDRIGAGIASLATDESYSDLLKEARQGSQGRLQRQVEQNPKTAIASNIAGSLATGIAGATTKGGKAIASNLAKGNILTRGAKAATVGAASGAAFGAGSAKEGERLEGAKEGAIVSGAIGGALPVAGQALKGIASTVKPQIDDATKALAKRATELGIPLRLDQISPTRARKTVQKISQEVPFSGADAFEDGQRQAFNRAVAKTIGQNSDNLSPDVINKFADDNSELFKNVVTNELIDFSDDSINKIKSISEKAKDNLGTNSDAANVIDRNIKNILQDLSLKDTGLLDISGKPIKKASEVSGVKIANIRSDLLKKQATADSKAKPFLSQIIDEIDNITNKNISSDKQEALKTARRQYRNYKTIEPLLEGSTDGNINPTQLLNRVKSSKFIKASKAKTGKDDLVDLARIGKQFLPKQGGSDTFQKTAFTAGGLTALSTFNPILAAKIGGGIAANRGLQKVNQSQKLIDIATKTAQPKGISTAPLSLLIASGAVNQ